MENPLPSARGNSTERTEATPEERSRGEGPAEQPAPAGAAAVETPERALDPNAESRYGDAAAAARAAAAGRLAGRCAAEPAEVRRQESFDNQKGSSRSSGRLQFDTKGVEFGPWIRRFVSQVRRNWFVPYAAMSLRGRVVITFFVHRNGALTDVTVIAPVERRLVQHGRHERAARLEPHRAAAAGVSGRQGVLHGHVLLQRIAGRPSRRRAQ